MLYAFTVLQNATKPPQTVFLQEMIQESANVQKQHLLK